MNSDYDDVVKQEHCPGCGRPTWFLTEGDPDDKCLACLQEEADERVRFKAKLDAMRASNSIPRYNGPRATNS